MVMTVTDGHDALDQSLGDKKVAAMQMDTLLHVSSTSCATIRHLQVDALLALQTHLPLSMLLCFHAIIQP